MTSKNENETPAPADIQAARAWCESRRLHSDPSGLHSDTLLRALDALERGDESVGLRAWLQSWLVDLTAERDEARATLASCNRARRAAEEECERLRTFVVDLEVHHLADEQSVRNMQRVIDTLTADRDRLAARRACVALEDRRMFALPRRGQGQATRCRVDSPRPQAGAEEVPVSTNADLARADIVNQHKIINELQQRIKMYESNSNANNKNITALITEQAKLRIDIAGHEVTIAALRLTLSEITAERDDLKKWKVLHAELSDATLASCDRARRAAEEECALLRAKVEERQAVIDSLTTAEYRASIGRDALRADRDRLAADNAELEAALAAQREALQSCIDSENRLAARVVELEAKK